MALPICISLGFWALGVPRTQRLLRQWAVSGKTKELPIDNRFEIRQARRAQRVVKRAIGVAGTCLVRSLTLWTILLRRGLSTDLRVGFRKRQGKIEGHAWLEYGDAPINDNICVTQTYVTYEHPVSFDMWRRIKQSEPSRMGT